MPEHRTTRPWASPQAPLRLVIEVSTGATVSMPGTAEHLAGLETTIADTAPHAFVFFANTDPRDDRVVLARDHIVRWWITNRPGS